MANVVMAKFYALPVDIFFSIILQECHIFNDVTDSHYQVCPYNRDSSCFLENIDDIVKYDFHGWLGI